MNKRTVRAFSLGILVTTITFAVLLYFLDEPTAELATSDDEKREMTAEIENLTTTIARLEEENHELKDKIRSLEEKAKEPPPEPVLIEIHAGMTNDDVVELLYEKNIITDKAHFKQFMVEQGSDRKLQVGTYILYPNMPRETIAKIITKSAADHS